MVGADKTKKSLFQAYQTICNTKKSNICNIETNILNNFFAKIGENLSRSFKPSSIENSKIKRVEQSCVFFPTSPSELSKIIRSLKNKKSAGHDALNSEIVKISLPVICYYSCNVFNNCFEKGYFPLPFKKAKVIPLHKEGTKIDPANYRPISLLTSFYKTFESFHQ